VITLTAKNLTSATRRRKGKSALESRQLDPTFRGNVTEDILSQLKNLVIGQEEAIQAVVTAWQVQYLGLQAPGRPLSSMLFLGPTGVGKTHLVESLARVLHGDSHQMLKVDCGEFQHGHEIAKLVGSPPGYLGHRETSPMLAQRKLDALMSIKHRVTILLFDEIEKANDALWNLLLGILDKASCTLGDNSFVDFSRCMIFLTGNVGSREIAQSVEGGMGFTPITSGGVNDVAASAARRRFTPEFMNRLDYVVAFSPLTQDNIQEVLLLELQCLQERVGRVFGPKAPVLLLQVTPEACRYLVSRGHDSRYGARHLRRNIEKYITQPLTNILSSGQVSAGELVEVDYSHKGMAFIAHA
jgi:ATP-dependent Clp protease ATP-binding subunit ClpA